ncbi:MAG: hypothetical protein LBC83_05995 [Oscillospiraceae bacterium]|nr:hypothetical protein [Oscillospiraceae bacterium]
MTKETQRQLREVKRYLRHRRVILFPLAALLVLCAAFGAARGLVAWRNNPEHIAERVEHLTLEGIPDGADMWYPVKTRLVYDGAASDQAEDILVGLCEDFSIEYAAKQTGSDSVATGQTVKLAENAWIVPDVGECVAGRYTEEAETRVPLLNQSPEEAYFRPAVRGVVDVYSVTYARYRLGIFRSGEVRTGYCMDAVGAIDSVYCQNPFDMDSPVYFMGWDNLIGSVQVRLWMIPRVWGAALVRGLEENPGHPLPIVPLSPDLSSAFRVPPPGEPPEVYFPEGSPADALR